jgi:CHAD domain-containing protein
MATNIASIAEALEAKQSALLSRYNDKDLHHLRTHIRRLRGVLKQLPGKEARALKKRWKAIADATNDARDWDTFLGYLNKSVPEAQLQPLQPLIQIRQKQAHERALAAIGSEHWKRSLEELQVFTIENVDVIGRSTVSDSACRHVAHDACEAAQRARQRNTEASWHKFRIAVKSMRYTLEDKNLSRKKRKDLQPLHKLCKELQDSLGEWHDTVIHAALLLQLNEDAAKTNASATGGLIQSIEQSMMNRRAEKLEEVITLLEKHGDLLATATK